MRDLLVPANQSSAGPMVPEASDPAKLHLGAILGRINQALCKTFEETLLSLQESPIKLSPELETALNRLIDAGVLPDARTAVIGDPSVFQPMHMEDRNGSQWFLSDLRSLHRSRDRCDGRDLLGHHAGEIIAQTRAVGPAGCINTTAIDSRDLFEVVKDGTHELDLVDLVPQGRPAAGARVPRFLVAFRIHDDEIRGLAGAVQGHLLLKSFSCAETRMKRQRDRQPVSVAALRRKPCEIPAGQPIDHNRPLDATSLG